MLSKLKSYLYALKKIGYVDSMNNFDKRRLGIFNIMNAIGVLTGLLIPIAAVNGKGYIPTLAIIVAFSPFFISAVVLISNYFYKHKFAIIWYFIMYPSITTLIYLGNIDVGIELLFILYAVLSVFFLNNLKLILITVFFSVSCYFATFVLHGTYNFVIKDVNITFYIINQGLAVFLIFYGLILVKSENNNYQKIITTNNNKLQIVNTELKRKRLELTENNYLLEEQKDQLAELNVLKNKMFSIISHDLRNPIYSLRNLFRNVQQYNLPGEEIKVLLPDILNDLNYTANLTENLLQWAKSQMDGNNVNMQHIELTKMITDTKNLMRLQAESKAIHLDVKENPEIFIYADKDMINLVLRNLLSNAIKFTPTNGHIAIGATLTNTMVEVFVKDTGVGISQINIDKLFKKAYYTTSGTANEAGTGLGLMLCKEFLEKNGGNIDVQSEIGIGSTFIFKLPSVATT